jgi:hypothetical protein
MSELSSILYQRVLKYPSQQSEGTSSGSGHLSLSERIRVQSIWLEAILSGSIELRRLPLEANAPSGGPLQLQLIQAD